VNELDAALVAFVKVAGTPATTGPVTSVLRGVVTDDTPLMVQVGIAATPTPAVNAISGYTPTVADVVLITRRGRRQYVTGGPL
jgi:hypothetical protein